MRYWLFRVTVTGESMWPRLIPGRTYWASSLLPYRVGSIVVATTPHRTVIKFVEMIDGKDIVLGDTQKVAKKVHIDRSQILGRLIEYKRDS